MAPPDLFSDDKINKQFDRFYLKIHLLSEKGEVFSLLPEKIASNSNKIVEKDAMQPEAR